MKSIIVSHDIRCLQTVLITIYSIISPVLWRPFILLFFSKVCLFSPAQYWKVSRTSNLVNKSGKWQFSSLKWSLPEENCEGPITDNASGKILDIVDQESLVELVGIEDASLLSNGQKWIKAKQNKDGWFMLINPSSNKVLTALTATTTSISGFYHN